MSAAPPDWLDDAACAQVADADAIFFPPRNASTAPARAVCARCPARLACLAYAVDRAIPYGVYGGLGERARRDIVRRRRGAA